ncbi:hypothetical protein ONZ45_g5995 [Pleurotus djamor]|nr:hypothetical protein ONZ45_g5995 [Pleurotus djamor]
MKSDSEEDRGEDDHDGIIWHAPGPSVPTYRGSLRSRILGSMLSGPGGRGGKDRENIKMISTTPGMLGAGETETEADEPPTRLPTSRILPSSAPLIPPSTLQERLTPLLFEFSRLLAIVPALIGTLYNLYFVFHGPDVYQPGKPEKVDYAVAALWVGIFPRTFQT